MSHMTQPYHSDARGRQGWLVTGQLCNCWGVREIRSLLFFFFKDLCVCACARAHAHMSAGACQAQTKISHPLELAFQAVVSLLPWDPNLDLLHELSAESSLNHWIIPPASAVLKIQQLYSSTPPLFCNCQICYISMWCSSSNKFSNVVLYSCFLKSTRRKGKKPHPVICLLLEFPTELFY